MIDFIKIKVKAGDGGKGCVAWRHEKFYANGGPFGGEVEAEAVTCTLKSIQMKRL